MLTVTNCTFSSNSGRAGGALVNVGGGRLTLTNTIVANSPSGGNCVVGVAIVDGGHNLDSDGTCGVGPATDPMLDPAGLANNGGPTQTIALRAGSPAINFGNEAVCAAPPVNTLDQRGYVRPGLAATNCSIGAYESNLPGPTVCCQCATSCAVPINASCGNCTAVFGATCQSGDLCVSHTPPTPTSTPSRTATPTRTMPSPTPTLTATKTPGANDCCQCADFCAAPIVGTCGGCAVVFDASCSGESSCLPRTPTSTPTVSQTATPTNTATNAPTQTVPPTLTPPPCAGDCDHNHQVTVDELIVGVNIALGTRLFADCPSFDTSNEEMVTVDELIVGVNNALFDCPAR